MHINLEATEKHSIQRYSESEIEVNSLIYQKSLLISSHEIISDWPIKSINELNEDNLEPILRYQPNIIIIGHKQQGQFPPFPVLQNLAKHRVGLECMSIGAACRTYNILLSELREVVIGIIL